MPIKNIFAVLLLAATITVCGQAISSPKKESRDIDQNFCNTLSLIVGHINDDFSLIKGAKVSSKETGIHYVSKGTVMGTNTSYIIFDSGWRYEGILSTGYNREKMTKYYNEYVRQLEHCYTNGAYKGSIQVNRDKSMPEYPDVVYSYKTGGATTGLKVRHVAGRGPYTLVVWVSK
jgi:hypothetical protein